TLIGENRLLDVPRMEPLRRELLETALKYYRKFLARHGDDPSVRNELANAYERVGRITDLIGSKSEALAAHRQSLEFRRALVRDNPGVDLYRRGLGINHLIIGTIQSETNQSAAAEASFREGIAILELVLLRTPDLIVRHNLATAYNNLGFLLKR